MFRSGQRGVPHGVPCRSPHLEGPGRQEEVVLVLPVVRARTRAVYCEAACFYRPPTSARSLTRRISGGASLHLHARAGKGMGENSTHRAGLTGTAIAFLPTEGKYTGVHNLSPSKDPA